MGRVNILRLALEEIATGKANKEIEHTYYAQLTNPEELKGALQVEKQEQWEVRVEKLPGFNALGGSIRVRKTVIDSGDELSTQYVLTTKVVGGEQGARTEIALECTEDMFTAFKFLSGKGMIKHRHRFPVEGTDRCFEVDVYLKPDGTYHDWVRIDFEVDDLKAPVPKLPVSVNQDTLVTAAKADMTAEENAMVTKLYDDVFLSRNQYIKDPQPKAEPVKSGQSTHFTKTEALAAAEESRLAATPLDKDGTEPNPEP